MTPITLGFMPLTDCVPLVVAKHVGFFEKWGLDVSLVKQNSWATLRDKLHANMIDGAHMLAPMVFASTLGLNGQENLFTPFVLSRQGNAVTLSNSLFDECISLGPETKMANALPLPASRLNEAIQHRAQQGRKLTFATVHPYSCHFYQLRSWLAQYQIPIESIDVIVIPPSHMVEAMSRGDIDGFCVGSPWNAQAVRLNIGVTAVTSCDIWPAMPEKVLGLKAQWYEQQPDAVHQLVNALREACDWLSTTPNRFEAARILTSSDYLGAPIDVLTPSLLDSCLTQEGQNPRLVPMYNQFGQENGAQDNCPTVSQGEWILNQMMVSGHAESQAIDRKFVGSVFREDIYQQALSVAL